jgi:basic secretory peptidase family protein
MEKEINGASRRRLTSAATATIGAALLLVCTVASAEVRVVIEHNDNSQATPAFRFKNIPSPLRGHSDGRANFILVDGEPDENSGDLEVLNDGKLPVAEDEPSENFFFKAGTDGGRLLVDLGGDTEIREVNTFSWHPGSRGPQVYTLYAAGGGAPDFNARPRRGTDPATVGWRLLAKVDTRPNGAQSGGQYGVHIFDNNGGLGVFRYLLFDISRTESSDAFGNTFYSEIDVVDSKTQATNAADGPTNCVQTLDIADGLYRITIDSCGTPDLTEWSKTDLAPVLREWYPKLVKLLPSDEFAAPQQITVRFSETLRGVAETSGTRIKCAAKWFRANLKGEAIGSVVHELVHVVQQYGTARRANPNATPPPGWLVEGIADYIRWFLYEPQSHGADATWLRERKSVRLRYDAGYRLTANFLNWVVEKYDRDIVRHLNSAMRAGNYREELWKERTGRALQDLGAEWKQELEQQLERRIGVTH